MYSQWLIDRWKVKLGEKALLTCQNSRVMRFGWRRAPRGSLPRLTSPWCGPNWSRCRMGRCWLATSSCRWAPICTGAFTRDKSYAPPLELDKPLDGGAVGEVVESRTNEFRVGDAVTSSRGWRE